MFTGQPGPNQAKILFFLKKKIDILQPIILHSGVKCHAADTLVYIPHVRVPELAQIYLLPPAGYLRRAKESGVVGKEGAHLTTGEACQWPR